MAVVLVTGTSTGIGRATALHFARKGDTVYATMRNLERGGKLRDATAAEGLPLHLLELDVDDDGSVQRGVDAALARSGRIDVLVNNAGIGGGASVEGTPPDELRAVFETNFFGAIRTTQAVLPGMRAQRGGAIVNVTSVAGRLEGSPQFAYASSKWALEAASEVLAQEVAAFNIRVAIVEPGVILTPIFAKGSAVVDERSPYASFQRRILALFAERLKSPSPPEAVAEAIYEAVTTSEPKLRYPVGWDAVQLIEGRQAMTDEEWVSFGLPMTDAEYWALWKEKFGMEIPAGVPA